ncbi:hypothetical protein AGABI1DRAFT_118462 [Agaricus bisporus var. burnettii JB137-S8]|uniref:Uncharacterized protein n=1 Tax=Agaricus bisporus var. burnettii (strain JB137-S8 / ATCC MYA-4627 / FGSC 10392) TaxID=597362 RepID=K5X5G3_AGABU|nr:uncharacterized protein AGABI1DRAFT_118462 [Agaricus bisporus var. burnettii JB137-S8]EKM83071.1 hypothetical protein AGABI1DRAFT_118462 [Agaricus bisporus var. burnettii JB137-S8]
MSSKAGPKDGTRFRYLSYLALLSAAVTLTNILPTPWSLVRNTVVRPLTVEDDPASEWEDNIWPLREQTPWDISTDYPYPRTLEYDVTEGTWLRLDVHPISGDVIFDMLGDIYCLPGGEALRTHAPGEKVKARPVLLGIPYDSDPHFSPEGDRFVFRSDAGLGIENIWVAEWKGCEAMDVRAMGNKNEDLRAALQVKQQEEDLLKKGVVETEERKHRRLIREGRAGGQWVSDARFHPSGLTVIATKWYTSSRSLGAGEGWEYNVPSLEGPEGAIGVASGSRVLGRSLPLGWTVDDYERQQIGPEQFIWSGQDSIIFSKNVRDSNAFEYSKDIHQGIYSIFQRNITTGRTKTLVDAYPGGASRPELSHDGRTLAFVRRVRDKEALVLKDLQTGTLHHIWHGLTYDLTIISAPMGTYPSFSFSPSDDAVILWAAGQIYRVPLRVNGLGEKTASDQQPSPIPFAAHIEKQLAKTLRGGANVLEQETARTQRVHSLKNLRVDESGERVVFEGAGLTYIQNIRSKETHQVPVAHPEAPYYSPAFIHGRREFILHARWTDTKFTSFELSNVDTGATHEFEGLPLGRYFSPVVCECRGLSRRMAFIKTSGTTLTGDIVATSNPGLYVANIELPSTSEGKIVISHLQFIPSNINPDDRINMRFIDGASQLLVQDSQTAFTINLSKGADGNGDYEHTTIASGRMSAELTVSPVERNGVPQFISFVDFFNVYLALGDLDDEEGVWSKPANATKGLVRVSLDGGHDVTWSGDGNTVFWLLGPFVHSLEVSQLKNCADEVRQDRLNFGIDCVKKLVKYQEVFIEHATDIARLKHEAASLKESVDIQGDSDVFVVTNATLLTMATGNAEDDLIHDAVLVTRGGVIEYAGPASGNYPIPAHANSINAQGGFVVPGFIDVHAHWNGFADIYPAKSWEMETFLAYGVTTLHNPSADNVAGFVERSRVERGQMVGPRIYTVGDIIYGSGAFPIHQDITTQEEANSALLRIKAEGGPASISYKNYNIPSRASRQRLLLTATNLSMLCVPEGGMNYDWDLTYIIDGMTTVEHAIPVPVLYDDVLTLFALSGTGSTPTHIVNYGGAFGEQFVWATHDIPNDPKLRRFTRHDILEGLSESTARPLQSYALFNTSASVAKMVEKGILTHIGAHGEPPLGVNYHAEMWFAGQGGLSNYEVIRAATSSGAQTLGMFSSLGSLSAGKLADYLIYPSGVDLLNEGIDSSLELTHVARGGRLWDASTMEEVWPVKGRKQELPPLNAE